MKKAKNITIIIGRKDVIRNFLLLDAFKLLDENFNVTYLVNNNLHTSDVNTAKKILAEENFQTKNLLYYDDRKNSKDKKKIFYRKFILMYKNIHKSKTFKFRVERMLYPLDMNFNFIPNLNKLNSFKKISKVLKFSAKVFFNNIQLLKVKFFSQKYIFKTLTNFLYNIDTENVSLISSLDKTNPDIVILPYSGTEIETNDVASYCKNKKVISYYITDNWDNLSSKSILENKPDYIGVWGEQAKEHAIKIQNFTEKQIFLLGSPRFDLIYSKRNKTKNENSNFKYILFLGHLFDWNEESALEIIDEEIKNNKDLYTNLKIIYRPHPQRINRMRDVSSYSNVILDEDLKKEGTSWPSLENYYNKIHNSIFVVGTLTSGLLESIACYKKYLLLCYYEKNDFFSQGKLIDEYTHMEELKNISSLVFCNKKDEIYKHFRDSFKNFENIKNKEKIDEEKKYFIFNDSKNSFNDLLNESILKINSKII